MQLNYWLLLATGLIPLIIGFLWYNPSIMGKQWLNTVGITDEVMKGANMPVIFILTYVLGCMLSLGLHVMVIHQMAITSIFANDKNADSLQVMDNFFKQYGTRFRTFKHGVFHGILGALFIALPVIGTNAIWARKGATYIFIHVGYWLICMALMGGVICAFM